MIQQTEFEIEELKGVTFRVGKVAPTEILAISTQIDFDNFGQSLSFINFALEHLEVKMGEKFNPVKVKGKDIYMPLGLDDNLMAMNSLVAYFLEEVIAKAFMKSSESQKNTQ